MLLYVPYIVRSIDFYILFDNRYFIDWNRIKTYRFRFRFQFSCYNFGIKYCCFHIMSFGFCFWNVEFYFRKTSSIFRQSSSFFSTIGKLKYRHFMCKRWHIEDIVVITVLENSLCPIFRNLKSPTSFHRNRYKSQVVFVRVWNRFNNITK